MIHSTNLNKSNYSNITTLPIQRKAIAPYFNGIDNDSFNKNTDKKSTQTQKSTPFFKNKILNFIATHLLGYSILNLISLLPAPVTGKWFNPFKSKENLKIQLQVTALIYAAIVGFVYLDGKNKNK